MHREQVLSVEVSAEGWRVRTTHCRGYTGPSSAGGCCSGRAVAGAPAGRGHAHFSSHEMMCRRVGEWFETKWAAPAVEPCAQVAMGRQQHPGDAESWTPIEPGRSCICKRTIAPDRTDAGHETSTSQPACSPFQSGMSDAPRTWRPTHTAPLVTRITWRPLRTSACSCSTSAPRRPSASRLSVCRVTMAVPTCCGLPGH